MSRAYFVLGAARGRTHAARQAVDNAEVVQDAARSRRDNGLGTVVNVAQAERQAAQARFSLVKAEGEERKAYADLVAVIGLDADARLEIADSTERALPPEPSATVAAFIRDALANRPDVMAALGRVESAQGVLNARRAANNPEIALVAQAYENIGSLSTDSSPWYNVNRPGGNILLTIKWPLFDGGARDAGTRIAQSELSAARERLAQLQDTAVAQVVGAYNDLRTSLAAHAAASTLVATARTSYDAALFAYVQGVGTYTDVASEQTSLARAYADREDAHAGAFTAAAALALATGAITKGRND